MTVTIKKAPSLLKNKEDELKTTSKKPIQRRGSKPKNTKADREAKEKLQGMESSMAKFHGKDDKDLASFIKPKPEVADRHTHRLDAEQLEARLVLVHRMMIRKMPPEEIRKQLGVSTTMYYKIRDQLSTRMRLDVNKVDVPYLIGDSLAFYDEVRSMALVISSSGQIKDPRIKIQAMGIALRAEDDKNKFLTSCGVYSAPVVEHIVRGMVSTGNFNTVDGQSQRVVDAEEVNIELALRLKEFARTRRENAITCNLPEQAE